MAPHPEPQRTCVGCRKVASKRNLLRVVRMPDRAVRLDPEGTAPGRATYVHADPACVRAAIARGAVSRSLRTSLGVEEAARLGDAIEREIERDVQR